MSLPSLPSAAAMSVADVRQYGAEVVAWAEQIEDLSEVREAASKWAAITEYVRRTSREGVAEAEAALRRLEVRVGQLLGPATVGSVTPEPLDRHERHDFRALADHADIVEQVIAESTDAEPPSRRKVLTRIRETKQAAEWASTNAEDRQWAADLREQAGSDPVEDRRRQQIRMDVRAVTDAIERLAERWSPGDVRWAIDTSFAHVRGDLTDRLQRAAASLQEMTK